MPSPSAPPKFSAAETEELVLPIALYPDALVATILPTDGEGAVGPGANFHTTRKNNAPFP